MQPAVAYMQVKFISRCKSQFQKFFPTMMSTPNKVNNVISQFTIYRNFQVTVNVIIKNINIRGIITNLTTRITGITRLVWSAIIISSYLI